MGELTIGPGLGGSSLLACLVPCLERAGRAHEPAMLAGLFGHAFESSWALGGGELWAGCAIEWGHYGAGLARLGVLRETFDSLGNPLPGRGRCPSDEERSAVLRAAHAAIARSVARGVPGLVWSAMSVEQRDAGKGAFCWGLVEGVEGDEYLVVHRDAGRYRVRADALGRVDPRQWFHAEVFAGPDPAHDPPAAHRSAVADAVRLLSGELAGADMPSPPQRIRHGVAALYAWAGDVDARACPADASRQRARFLADARRAAAVFLRSASRAEAASLAERQAKAFEILASGAPDSRVLREAADLQTSLIAVLRADATMRG